MPYAEARRLLGSDRIVGVTCGASRDRAITAAEAGADYVAFGAFFPSVTKTATKHHADPELIRDWSETTVVPCCAIGGITQQNCGPLVEAGHVVVFLPRLLVQLLRRRSWSAAVVGEGDSDGPWLVSLPSAILFLDISGFTSLTESFAQIGVAGLERLTSLLNVTFTCLLDIIRSHRGDGPDQQSDSDGLPEHAISFVAVLADPPVHG